MATETNKLVEIAKSSAIAKYTSEHNTEADYETFMNLETDEDLMNSMFVIWEPFERCDIAALQEYVESEFSTTLALLENTIKTVFVNVNEINLRVKLTDVENNITTVETDVADFEECPVCGSSDDRLGHCSEAFFDSIEEARAAVSEEVKFSWSKNALKTKSHEQFGQKSYVMFGDTNTPTIIFGEQFSVAFSDHYGFDEEDRQLLKNMEAGDSLQLSPQWFVVCTMINKNISLI